MRSHYSLTTTESTIRVSYWVCTGMNDGLNEGFFLNHAIADRISAMPRQSCVCGSSGHKRTGQVGNPAVNDEMLSQHMMIDTSSEQYTNRTTWSGQLTESWSTATVASLCAPTIRQCLLHRRLHARVISGSPSSKTIGSYGYSGLVDMDNGVPIDRN